MERESKFTNIYLDNLWLSSESKSGKGSTLLQTDKLRPQLIELINSLNIATLIDSPCGDFNWFKEMLPQLNIKKYIGIDIVKEMIVDLKDKYSNDKINFYHNDIVTDPLPSGDLCFCRDALVHLTYDSIFSFLINLANSGATYFLTTTFDKKRKNSNLKGDGEGWFPICLMNEPFNFPEPIKLINEGCSEDNNNWTDKSLGLWNISDLRTWLEYNNQVYQTKKQEKERILVASIIAPKTKKPFEPTKIPKIAHFYWGETQLPFLRYLSVYTFMLYNPDWDIRYYYPKNRCENKSWKTFEQKYEIKKGADLFGELNKLPIKIIEFDCSSIDVPSDISEVYKSDFLRWHLLSTVGGFWSDMDVVYFKSMKELPFNNEVDTVISIHPEHNYHSIGFMMGSKNNEYYANAFKLAKKHFNISNYQSIGSVLFGKDFNSLSKVREMFPNLTIENLPMDVVYAYDAQHISDIFNSADLSKFTESSIGLHWYAGHPVAGEYINSLNNSNCKNYYNIISEVIQAALQLKMVNFIYSKLKPEMKGLDAGCGDKRFSGGFRKICEFKTVDVFPSFKPDVLWDLSKTPLPFPDNSFDVIFHFDVIEHLDKPAGERLLRELKRITRKYIFLLTPLWWDNNIHNTVDQNDPHYGNKYNIHKSLWQEEDFPDWERISKLGYLEKYYFGLWTKIKPGITVHSVIKNEPFIYYSIKSAYPYVDKILLYDTGSNDKHTMKDIIRLLEEDIDHKIIFKRVPIETEEDKWSVNDLQEQISKNKGKFGVGRVRQMQIDDTETEFFMILDGDEVYYKETMENLTKSILPNLNKEVLCVAVPLTWYYDLSHSFGYYSTTGRVFRTNKIKMNGNTPNENHIIRETGKEFQVSGMKEYYIYSSLKPYAHFETYLKPWRRKSTIKKEEIKQITETLPEVMEADKSFIYRFEKENKND